MKKSDFEPKPADFDLSENDISIYDEQVKKWHKENESHDKMALTISIVWAVPLFIVGIALWVDGCSDDINFLYCFFATVSFAAPFILYYGLKSKTNDDFTKYKYVNRQLETKMQKYNAAKLLPTKLNIIESNEVKYLKENKQLYNYLINYAYILNSTWKSINTHVYTIKSHKYASEISFENSLYCLKYLTPLDFVKMYFTFKEKDRLEIKDALYVYHYYILVEPLIEMGLYIFKTNNNIKILKFIISDDFDRHDLFNNSFNKNDLANIKLLAKGILNEELSKQKIRCLKGTMRLRY